MRFLYDKTGWNYSTISLYYPVVNRKSELNLTHRSFKKRDKNSSVRLNPGVPPQIVLVWLETPLNVVVSLQINYHIKHEFTI